MSIKWCISHFAFFVGLVLQCIIGVCGLIGIRIEATMKKERVLFFISIIPLFFVIILFLINRTYSAEEVLTDLLTKPEYMTLDTTREHSAGPAQENSTATIDTQKIEDKKESMTELEWLLAGIIKTRRNNT